MFVQGPRVPSYASDAVLHCSINTSINQTIHCQNMLTKLTNILDSTILQAHNHLLQNLLAIPAVSSRDADARDQ